MASTAIEVKVVPAEEVSLKKVDIKTDDPQDKEYITFCDLCCPKGQDFDPANPLDWLASLLSLAFFLLAGFGMKYLLFYCIG